MNVVDKYMLPRWLSLRQDPEASCVLLCASNWANLLQIVGGHGSAGLIFADQHICVCKHSEMDEAASLYCLCSGANFSLHEHHHRLQLDGGAE